MPKIVDHEERRRHIVEIVANMLVTVGVEKTTIREISRQSGYSRGFIEHYIHNKEDLITESVKFINEGSIARGTRKLKGKRGLEALRVMNQAVIPLDAQGRKDWIIRLQFWGLAVVDAEYREKQSQEAKMAERLYMRYLQQAQERGEIAADIDLQSTAQYILHRIYGLSCDAILRPHYFTRERKLMELDSIMESLINPGNTWIRKTNKT